MKPRKILSALLSAVMLLSATPGAVLADTAPIVYQSEFNGNDSAENMATWSLYADNSTYVSAFPETIVPANGYMRVTANDTATRAFGIRLPEGTTTKTKKIIVDTRFMCEDKADAITTSTLLSVRALDGTYNAFAIRAQAGVVSWSGNNPNSWTNTEITLEPGIWYELICELDFANRKPSFTIKGNGETYTVEADNFAYGGAIDLRNIKLMGTWGYPYANNVWDIDYVRVYDEAAVTPVTATYAGDDLANATGVSISDPEIALNFESAITADDLAGITINNGATIEPTLGDGQEVTLVLKNLEASSRYTLTVPMIGTNKSASFSFLTEDDGSGVASLDALYNGEALDGAMSVALTEPDITLVLGRAITDDEDLSEITIDGGASLEPRLLETGKEIELAVTGLEPRTGYTITVPALGDNPDGEFTFQTANDPMYIFRAEFDGLDDTTGWGVYKSNNSYNMACTATPANGTLTVTRNAFAYGTFGAHFDGGLTTTDKAMVVTTKFRATQLSAAAAILFTVRRTDNYNAFRIRKNANGNRCRRRSRSRCKN